MLSRSLCINICNNDSNPEEKNFLSIRATNGQKKIKNLIVYLFLL